VGGGGSWFALYHLTLFLSVCVICVGEMHLMGEHPFHRLTILQMAHSATSLVDFTSVVRFFRHTRD
jgi:hypothetical protein